MEPQIAMSGVNEKIKSCCRCAWEAQWVECPILGLHPDHGPTIMGSSPTLGSVLGVDPAWDSLSHVLSLPPSLSPLLLLSPTHVFSL